MGHVHRAAVVVGGVAVLSMGAQEIAFASQGKCAAGFFDLACEAGNTVADSVQEAVRAPVTYAAGGAVDMFTAWVSDSAQWFLSRVVSFIEHSTSPDLGASWFQERFEFMTALAALVVLPMLLLAAICSVARQDMAQLARSFFVYLPLAILATFISIFLAGALLDVTDGLSAAVSGSIAGDVNGIFDDIRKTLNFGVGPNPSVPSFAIFFVALALLIGAFLVWLELLVRSAAITVSVFFLPLVLAALVWPATAHWTKRLVETLAAVILSKFVIVSVLSLAAAALDDPGPGGFGTVMGGAALMFMAALSPFALLKLMPLAEGAALNQFEGMSRRPVQAATAANPVNHALSVMRAKVAPNAGLSVAGSNAAVSSAVSAVGLGAMRGAARAAREPGRRLEKATEPATTSGVESSRLSESAKAKSSAPRPRQKPDKSE